MTLIAASLLALASPAQFNPPRTYLASLTAIPMDRRSRIDTFSFDTFGVVFKAVCRIPSGWRIRAGANATLDGVFEGQASQGATWLDARSLKGRGPLLLVTLSSPLRQNEVRATDGSSVIPATFSGWATVQLLDADRPKKVNLNATNIRLVPARECPKSDQ